MSPEMDIRTACLDGYRHPKVPAQCNRGGTIGEEEFGIDDVKGKGPPDICQERHQAAGYRTGIEASFAARQVHKAGAIHTQSLPVFRFRSVGKTAIMRVQAEREGRQANGGDNLKLDIGVCCKAKRLPFYKWTEAWARDVWKEGR